MIKFMKLSLCAVALILVSASTFGAPNKSRYYLVPTSRLGYFKHNRPLIIKSQGGLSLVLMNQSQLEGYSQQAHLQNNVCGGFLDVQIQMDLHHLNLQQALEWGLQRPVALHLFNKLAPTYPEQVKKVMGLLKGDRLVATLKELVAFPDRSASTDSGIKASKWIAARAAELAKGHNRTDVMIKPISTGSGYPQESVLVRIQGQDSSLPGVLIGGHMDTLSDHKPGADDDGTGSVTAMEIYTAILDSGMHFKRDLYFAFYAAEERGLYGSQAVAAEFRQRKIPMRAILQFDMTGFKSPKDTQEIYLVTDHVDENLTTFLKNLATTYVGLPQNMVGTTRCGYSCSDHASWTNAGYPSAFPFEASFQNDNKAIHTERDTMDLLSGPHVMNFLKLGAAFAVETADPL